MFARATVKHTLHTYINFVNPILYHKKLKTTITKSYKVFHYMYKNVFLIGVTYNIFTDFVKNKIHYFVAP